MGRRVYKATMNNDIEKAKHISGEYLIALQRRFAMFIVHATHAGTLNFHWNFKLPLITHKRIEHEAPGKQ